MKHWEDTWLAENQSSPEERGIPQHEIKDMAAGHLFSTIHFDRRVAPHQKNQINLELKLELKLE